jgi:TPR repeat protein
MCIGCGGFVCCECKAAVQASDECPHCSGSWGQQLDVDAKVSILQKLIRRPHGRHTAVAQVTLGRLLEEHADDTTLSLEPARTLYRRGVAGGNADAMFRLGLLEGRGGPAYPLLPVAVELYQNAIALGHPRAAVQLGIQASVAGDFRTAARCLEVAASQPYSAASCYAQFALAEMYETGQLELDWEKADRCYRLCSATPLSRVQMEEQLANPCWITLPGGCPFHLGSS